ncbi:MAG TPA: hypothetical protein VFU53_10775 [Burkholderiales bacterium]|nr:hypothetical protein [Burkholderiales bacterium]
MYEVVHTGQYYLIVGQGQPVRSPLGRAFLTAFRLLADDLCDDVNRYGPSAWGTSSLVTLHATYLDYGANVPRRLLENDLLARYDPAVDFALDRRGDRTAQAVFTAWFGPVAPCEQLGAWLRAASTRQLVSMTVAADVTGSAFIGYRVLHGELTASRLAAGVRKWDCSSPHTVEALTGILERVKRYAQVPDEPELLTAEDGVGCVLGAG